MKIVAMLAPLALLSLIGCDGDVNINVSHGKGEKGSGTLKTESRSLGTYKGISYDGVGEVNIVVGSENSFKVTCDDNLLTKFKTEVKDGVLQITCKDMSPTKLKVEISLNDLESFTLNGAGAVEIKGLKGQSFAATANGAGGFSIKGAVDKATITVNGAGGVDASELKANHVKAEVSGAGGINLNAEKTLDASINGIGSIEYSGNAVVTKKIDGIGSIIKSDQSNNTK